MLRMAFDRFRRFFTHRARSIMQTRVEGTVIRGCRVPLDKSEGVVKAQLFCAVLRAPRGCQRWWRTKTLEISR
jgi:hypothetical protein